MTIYSSLGGGGGSGGSGITTISGDSGSITGASVTVFSNNATVNSGSSVSFTNSGTTSTFNTTDTDQNTLIGKGSGNLTKVSAIQNTGIGENTLSSLTSGDANVAVGSVALQSLTTGGNNTCLGYGTGQSFVANDNNTCIGYNVLNDNTGDSNTVVGSEAGGGTGSGSQNSLVGFQAGVDLNNGNGNSGIGYAILNAVTTGEYNSALGWEALFDVTTGSYNLALGYNAGSQLTTSDSSNIYLSNVGVTGESHVMRLGTTGSGNNQVNKTFIAGVYGVTVGVSGIAAVVDNAGQVGTIVSSERFKENIQPIQDESILVQNLRPVSFSYLSDPEKTKCFGLIAEEVKTVMPELVVHGEDGLPLTVKYLDLPVLLLAEVQRLHKKIEALESKISSGENG